MPYSVYGFALAMALFTTGNALVLSSSVLVGTQLASQPSLATLPLVAQYIGLMLATLPMAHFMAKRTRRLGFLLGTLAGLGGALLAVYGIYQGQFLYFVIGVFGTGLAIGTAQQYRFAAIEEAPEALHSQAIAWVISGGIVAALVGPRLAVASRDLWAQWPFLGTFTVLAGVYILALVAWRYLPIKPLPVLTHVDQPRDYRRLYQQPPLRLIALTTGLAYGLLVFTVGALPLAMQQAGFSFSDLAWVMQAHILAMFAPSLLMGKLLDRIGIRAMFLLGTLSLIGTFAVHLLGQSFGHFLVAMTLLGLAWNILFLASTRLLPQTYRPVEKAKVQGATDLLIFASAAIASLLAAPAFIGLGWPLFNGLALLLAGGLLSALILYRRTLPARPAGLR